MMFNSIEQKVPKEKEEKIDWQEKVKMKFPFAWPFRLAALQTAERIINNKLPNQNINWEKVYQVCEAPWEQIFSTIYNSEQVRIINQCYQQFVQGDLRVLDKIYHFDATNKCLPFSQLLESLKNADCKLMSLDLGYNHIGDAGTKELAVILMNSNCRLSSLYLSYNYIEDAGAKALASALINPNCKLTLLDLMSNQISYVGAKAIAFALMNSDCQLSSLHLRLNRIGDAGAKEIAVALKSPNCKLTSLDLSMSRIEYAGVQEIITALMHPNCRLTLLDLRYNKISNIGAYAIALAQKNRCYPCNLNIKLDEKIQSHIAEFNYQWCEAQRLYTLFSHSNKNSQHLSVLPPFITVHCLFPYLYDIFKDELKEQVELKEVPVMKYVEEITEGKTIKKEKWILVKGEVSTGEFVYPHSQGGNIFLVNHDRHFVDVLTSSRFTPK